MTSTVDGRDHLISAQATAAGLMAGYGEYAAICGRLVVAAPLVVPPGTTYFDCETALHRTTTTTTIGTSTHRRRGLLARLVRRYLTRTGSRSPRVGNHRAGRA
ncbi:MAG: hypothetical protein ABR608_10030 [Pseudonocardiaceae bacterium]